MKDFGGGTPNWGYCESPLIDGEKCLCTPGGSDGAILALHKTTGEKIWQSKDFTDGAQYASIIAAEHGGKRQYIQLTQKNVVGVDASTGDVLWETGFDGKTAVIPTPIFHDGCVYVASGYGAGCKMVKLNDTKEPEEMYVNKNMTNHHGGVILVGEHLYGYSDGKGWICQDFKTGEIVWSEKNKLGKGSLTCAGGKLYLYSERGGEVVLIDASPDGFNEHGRFKIDPQSDAAQPARRHLDPPRRRRRQALPPRPGTARGLRHPGELDCQTCPTSRSFSPPSTRASPKRPSSCCRSFTTSCESSPRQSWPTKGRGIRSMRPPSYTRPMCGWRIRGRPPGPRIGNQTAGMAGDTSLPLRRMPCGGY